MIQLFLCSFVIESYGLFLFSLDRKKEPKKDQVCSYESEKAQNNLKYKNSLRSDSLYFLTPVSLFFFIASPEMTLFCIRICILFLLVFAVITLPSRMTIREFFINKPSKLKNTLLMCSLGKAVKERRSRERSEGQSV